MQLFSLVPAEGTVGALANPITVVSAGLRCSELDVTFRADDRLLAMAVRDEDGRTGLITRERFTQQMTGPFGFGWALWSNKPIAALVDWNPLIIDTGATVVQACERLRDRDQAHRYDDVLISTPGAALRRISPARMFEELAARMTELAITDALSGLANRQHLLDRLSVACADQSARPVLVFIDLDKMKQVNDTYGHNAGDRLIVSTARRLVDAARPGDLVARLGGDEFAVLCQLPPDKATAAFALSLGERLRAAVAAPDKQLAEYEHCHASVGVALGDARVDANTMLTEADMAMYQAKRAGGDTVRVVTGVGTELGGTDTAAGGLTHAIHVGELRLYYQPIWSVADNRIASIEALVRWQHPSHGLLTPDKFLPAAERAGELRDLDTWVLTRACHDLAFLGATLGDRAPGHVNVNLTVDTLQSEDVTAHVLEILTAADVDPARLCIELPETADLSVLTAVVETLHALREHGIAFTLDDMGAGSSTLRHLSVLPVSGIKIDRMFVQGMLDNRSDHAVVQLLTDLGHNLNLPVTAEGVETPEQLAALRELHVPYVQGYLLGRPQPLDQLIAQLQDTTADSVC